MTHDQVLDMLKYLGMGNRPEDKVKVIFVPCYLDGKDGILNKALLRPDTGRGPQRLSLLL